MYRLTIWVTSTAFPQGLLDDLREAYPEPFEPQMNLSNVYDVTVELMWNDKIREANSAFESFHTKLPQLMDRWDDLYIDEPASFEAVLGENDDERSQYFIHGFAFYKILRELNHHNAVE